MTPRACGRRSARPRRRRIPISIPTNPDAALRFRELVRAYDILTDTEQRATYDQLLAIALQPPAATKAVRTYEVIGKVASNTMAATVISAVLVGGYVLFGMFSKPPGAAEIAPDRIVGEPQVVAALHPDITASNEPRVQREGDASTVGAVVTSAVAPAAKEANAAAIGRFEPVPRVRLIQSGDSILPALRNRQFRPRHRSVSRRRFRPRSPRSLHPSPPRTRGGPRSPRLLCASRWRSCLPAPPARRQRGECRSPQP